MKLLWESLLLLCCVAENAGHDGFVLDPNAGTTYNGGWSCRTNQHDHHTGKLKRKPPQVTCTCHIVRPAWFGSHWSAPDDYLSKTQGPANYVDNQHWITMKGRTTGFEYLAITTDVEVTFYLLRPVGSIYRFAKFHEFSHTAAETGPVMIPLDMEIPADIRIAWEVKSNQQVPIPYRPAAKNYVSQMGYIMEGSHMVFPEASVDREYQFRIFMDAFTPCSTSALSTTAMPPAETADDKECPEVCPPGPPGPPGPSGFSHTDRRRRTPEVDYEPSYSTDSFSETKISSGASLFGYKLKQRREVGETANVPVTYVFTSPETALPRGILKELSIYITRPGGSIRLQIWRLVSDANTYTLVFEFQLKPTTIGINTVCVVDYEISFGDMIGLTMENKTDAVTYDLGDEKASSVMSGKLPEIGTFVVLKNTSVRRYSIAATILIESEELERHGGSLTSYWLTAWLLALTVAMATIPCFLILTTRRMDMKIKQQTVVFS